MDCHFRLQNNKEEAEEKTRYWQLPWIPPPKEELPSEEELARKAALKEKAGQRLREMAAQKRSQKIAELEEKLSSLEELLEQLDEAEEEAAAAILGKSGYLSPQEIKSDILKATQALRKAKGESNGNEDKADVSGADKYPLVSVPDEILTPEQVCVCAVIMGFYSCALQGMWPLHVARICIFIQV
jgi:actin-related protein 5